MINLNKKDNDNKRPHNGKRMSKVCIASLILSIFSFMFGFAAFIPAVLCGFFGIYVCYADETKEGNGFAIAGLIISAAWLLIDAWYISVGII